MNPKDKTYLENISKVLSILPDEKREYLLGVADGLAAAIHTHPSAQQPGARAGA